MRFVVRVDGQERTVFISRNNGYFAIEIDGREIDVDCRYFGDSDYLSLLIDNRSYLIETGAVKPDEGRYYARVMGRHYDLEVLDELLVAAIEARKAHEHSGTFVVASPMPGKIVDVKISVGDTVNAGDALFIMEAMKMQNELNAEAPGVVREIRVTSGQTVDSQTVLATIERV